MNFHTRTILDILRLDTVTRCTISDLIKSEHKLWKKTHRKKRGSKNVVSGEKLEKLNNAIFAYSVQPIVKAELKLYLETYGIKFLNSISMLWIAKDINTDKIDYAKFISEMIEN